MVRSALADESLLPYLENLAKPETCTVGLILGQPTPTKDYVIHFAKTPPIQIGDKVIKKSCEIVSKPSKNINEVLESWVADHAKHATRMLPGGMYILGIFVVSHEDLLSPFSSKLRSLLSHVHKTLSVNPYIYGNPETPEKLVLNYCMATKSYSCKSYNVITSAVKPAEFKFQPKALKWTQLECKYDLDQTFPIFEGRIDWTLKRHLQSILETINEHFKSAIYLFDHEIKDVDETLESIGKKRKINKSKNINKDKEDSKSIEISIFMPCDTKNTRDLEIKPSGGFIRIIGQIYCKLWLFPKQTIGSASEAIAQDIIRSLASRLEMHWDSLIDEESGSSEDVNSLHEPPRRVLITLPQNKVMLSDYLFPGEGASEALISLQELLDINIQDEKCIMDAEGQADLSDLYPSEPTLATIDSEDSLPIQLPTDTSKFMYVVGFILALIVLIISLTIHFVKGY